MTLTEGVIREQIYIDFDAEVHYGSDQVNEFYPVRFPTVGFQLKATNGLSEIADRIRKDLGFAPMHPMDEYTDETCDGEGWYDFFIGLNGYSKTRVDSGIEFIVVNSDSPDNEESYTIVLNESEQEFIYSRLDEQCQKYLGKSCEELLAEAQKEMEEYAAYLVETGGEREST